MLTYEMIEPRVFPSPKTRYEKGWNDCGHQIAAHIDRAEEEVDELVGYDLMCVVLQTVHFALSTEYGRGWNECLNSVLSKIRSCNASQA